MPWYQFSQCKYVADGLMPTWHQEIWNNYDNMGGRSIRGLHPCNKKLFGVISYWIIKDFWMTLIRFQSNRKVDRCLVLFSRHGYIGCVYVKCGLLTAPLVCMVATVCSRYEATLPRKIHIDQPIHVWIKLFDRSVFALPTNHLYLSARNWLIWFKTFISHHMPELNKCILQWSHLTGFKHFFVCLWTIPEFFD